VLNLPYKQLFLKPSRHQKFSNCTNIIIFIDHVRFAKNQPKQLRQKLSEIEREHRLGKIQNDVYTQQVLEILGALQKLGEELSEQEKEFLSSNMTAEMKNFVTVDNTGANINTSSVSSQIEKARK
jgi:hypothetical protein